MTEREKMIAGYLYDSSDEELVRLRRKAHLLARHYSESDETMTDEREKIIKELFPNAGKNVFFQGPIFVDYGINTTIGDNFYANFNLTILDVLPVKIGNNVFIGPNVSLLTPLHPLRYEERNIFMKEDGSYHNLEYGKPITIEDDCWIGGNVVINGGVTIHRGSVIGSGSVVTKDVPPFSLAFGNPCKVYREISEKDSVGIKHD